MEEALKLDGIFYIRDRRALKYPLTPVSLLAIQGPRKLNAQATNKGLLGCSPSDVNFILINIQIVKNFGQFACYISMIHLQLA